MDATVVSPVRGDGTPLPRAAYRPGVALAAAEAEKRSTYSELVHSAVLRLVPVAVETGGRMSKQAVALVEAAAFFRARAEPPVLQRAAARAWRTRWLTMLSVSVQDALAATLVHEGTSLLEEGVAPPPLGVDVWLDGH